jgi:myo-inositol-1-phosphate synthase
VKAQVGATITHRTLARLFADRGVRIDSTYQLNTGGNTDFLNMLSRERLRDKKISKTDAVQSQLDVPLPPERIHIGPSDYVPFMKDNKVCFLRIEGTGFGGVPLNLELRLSVEDSPNSAGSVIDAIRCCKLARDAKLAGPLEAASAWTMKHPPKQMSDGDARVAMEAFARKPS